MREILFKAKRKDNGKWVEGYYCKTTIGNDVRPSDLIFVPFKVSRNEEWGWMKVDFDTICQYTGLTDKNGKKIWENDILALDDIKWIVAWSVSECCYAVKDITNNVSIGLLNIVKIKSVVMGNIFDNPKLLEVE